VHEAAFPTPAEANLVDRLRANGRAVVALIAESDGNVVGHIVFSPVTLDPPARGIGLGLGPVAVLPEHEHHGVGRRLIQNGLAECKAQGAGFVVVVGEPVYYGRFGFERASKRGLNNEYGVDEAFMVFELGAGALPRFGGLVKYGPEFAALPKS
jgi:putative acetyltransferase